MRDRGSAENQENSAFEEMTLDDQNLRGVGHWASSPEAHDTTLAARRQACRRQRCRRATSHAVYHGKQFCGVSLQ